MNKNIFYYAATGLLVGILVTPFIFRSFWWPSTEEIAQKVAERLSIEVPSETPIVENYRPGFWQKVSAEGGLSTVGVQISSRIYNGVVLSADGLILTVSDFIPTSGLAQIVIEDEKYDAKLVHRDKVNHLAILKTSAPGLIASPLDVLVPVQPGADLVLVGKSTLALPVVKKTIVSSIVEDDVYLDTLITSELNGLKAINENGKVLGVALLRFGKSVLIPASIISETLNIYLESARK